MDIEEKGLARLDDGSIEMGGPEDEGTRPIGKAARAAARPAARFEDPLIDLAWRRLAKERAACAAYGVSARVAWKTHGFEGLELEAEPVKLKGNHASRDARIGACCIIVWHLTLVFRFVAQGGCVSPSAPPFLLVGQREPECIFC